MKCQGCPANCLGQSTHPVFCEWWASGDANLRAHVVNRSAIGDTTPPPIPATPPGLATKAANLARAIVTHVAAGLPEADAATADARLATCRACPDLDAPRMACNRCGCAMQVKVRWAEQKCPSGRW